MANLPASGSPCFRSYIEAPCLLQEALPAEWPIRPAVTHGHYCTVTSPALLWSCPLLSDSSVTLNYALWLLLLFVTYPWKHSPSLPIALPHLKIVVHTACAASTQIILCVLQLVRLLRGSPQVPTAGPQDPPPAQAGTSPAGVQHEYLQAWPLSPLHPTPVRILERMNNGDSAWGPGHSLPLGPVRPCPPALSPNQQHGCPRAKQGSPPCSSTQSKVTFPQSEGHGSQPPLHPIWFYNSGLYRGVMERVALRVPHTWSQPGSPLAGCALWCGK